MTDLTSNYALERSVRGLAVGAAGARRKFSARGALAAAYRGPLNADVRCAT